ncbi:hypothetical protein FS815_23875 [Agrobacterium vitis]|nr:hypothetical protein [Allorhizobium ampelinum]MCF1449831.1 hypothetical protein [Allorhizobium ampelinum]
MRLQVLPEDFQHLRPVYRRQSDDRPAIDFAKRDNAGNPIDRRNRTLIDAARTVIQHWKLCPLAEIDRLVRLGVAGHKPSVAARNQDRGMRPKPHCRPEPIDELIGNRDTGRTFERTAALDAARNDEGRGVELLVFGQARDGKIITLSQSRKIVAVPVADDPGIGQAGET